MILGLITLLTALCISGVAAYYSIVGLTAIFAAAVIPIIIMGVVLEVGKVVTTLWLHYNWERAPKKIKVYLTFAVGVLMFITSMGIFGFLSKSHLDQAVPSGDVQAQVALFDEKIKTQRDNIESDRKALTQLDAAVDQMMGRTTDEQGATKSANLRQSQKKERARLQTDIDDSQKNISKLQEERSPVASKLRKVEAEVGPIRYIAALIYGDKADQNMLEAAVRWVIIIIVLVFDPLAIILILAATTSIDWSKLDRKQKKHEQLEDAKEEARMQAELDESLLALKHHEDTKKSEEDILKIVEDTIAITRAECAVEAEKAKLAACAECSINLELQLHEAQDQIVQRTEEQQKREAEIQEITSLLVRMTNEANDLAAFVSTLEEDVSDSLNKRGALQGDLQKIIGDYDDLLQQKQALETAFEEAKIELSVLDEMVRQMGVLQEVIDNRDKMLDEKDKLFFRTVATKDAELIDSQRQVVELTEALEATAKLVIATPLPVLPPIEEEPRLFKTEEEQREIADMAFRAVFHDRPEYFKKPEVEPFPSDEELHEMYKDVLENEAVRAVGRWEEPELTPEVAVVEEQIVVDTEPAAEMPTPVDPLPLTPLPRKMAAMPSKTLLPPKHDIEIPKFLAMPDNFPMGGNASFGVTFPAEPIKGDLYLRVDYMPSKLFKWSGTRWIEVDKSITDTYAFDDEYIKLLVEKVSSGEYDVDDLSVTEQEQIAEYLRNNPK